MILEEETFEKFGYYPSDLKPKSHKRILVICDDCGELREIYRFSYHSLCKKCVQKGEKSFWFGKTGENTPRWKGGKIKRICKQCGTKFPVKPSHAKKGEGLFCSTECSGEWMTKHRRGKDNANWQGGTSFEPYCQKFNNEFKEYIRDKFGRICFLCPKTEEENGQRLSVHHVNYNKNCGCDGDETCQFVPLCRSCNSKVNKNREENEKKIKAKMQNKLNGWYI